MAVVADPVAVSPVTSFSSGSSFKGDVTDNCEETEPLCLGREDSLEPLRLPRDFLTCAKRPPDVADDVAGLRPNVACVRICYKL